MGNDFISNLTRHIGKTVTIVLTAGLLLSHSGKQTYANKKKVNANPGKSRYFSPLL